IIGESSGLVTHLKPANFQSTMTAAKDCLASIGFLCSNSLAIATIAPIIIVLKTNSKSISIYSWYQSSSGLLVGIVFSEVGSQNHFLVVHPPKLKGDLHSKQQSGPCRRELHEQSKDRYFFGEIERVAHKTIRPRRDKVSGLRHQTE